MKVLSIVLILLSTFSAIGSTAKEGVIVEGLIKKSGTISKASYLILKVDGKDIRIAGGVRSYSGNDLVVFIDTGKIESTYLPIATFEEKKIQKLDQIEYMSKSELKNLKLPFDYLTSTQKIRVKVIENVNVDRFNVKNCERVLDGCIPAPKFVTDYYRLIQMTTLSGEVICYKENPRYPSGTYRSGNCSKVSIKD